MFEQAFKNIDDILRKEAGCTTELDYIEQTSWLLFLKYLDALEQDKADEAALHGKKYAFILDKPYRWEEWAAPKSKDGQIDHNKAKTGDDLRDFVNSKLFPYFHGFKQRATGPNTIEYKIGEIFGEIKNKIQSGYNLREIIDHVDELRFRSQTEKHELSHLYEAKIRNMGNAGRNGGEYYTPRPLIRAIVQVVQPRIGERIYDGACGSAGFLCESFDYLKAGKNLTTKDSKTLQERTFYGKEKKSLAYVIAIMNMILHGIDAPNIIHTNTLTENLADIQEKDRFEIVMANPPFGGKERKEVQQNFPIRTGETAFLFLQHFIKILKAGGRGGIVIKNTFLSNTDNASASLRKLLLESCNLHSVLDCPGGTFQGAGVKTVVLFFEKGTKTRKIWFYQLDPGRNLGKTNPLNDDDLAEFVRLQKTFADSLKSWSVDAKTIDPDTCDLSVKNPNGGETVAHRSPQAIMDEIAALDAETVEVLQNIRNAHALFESYLQAVFTERGEGWPTRQLGKVCDFEGGSQPPKSQFIHTPKAGYVRFLQIRDFASEKHITFIAESKKNRLCRKEDIMIGRYGASVGKILSGKAGAYNVALMKTIPNPVLLDRDFFYHYLISGAFQERLLNVAARSAQNGFSKEDICGFPVPVPPLKEQQKVIDQLGPLSRETKKLESNCQRKLAALEALKESLLHEAFIGKL